MPQLIAFDFCIFIGVLKMDFFTLCKGKISVCDRTQGNIRSLMPVGFLIIEALNHPLILFKGLIAKNMVGMRQSVAIEPFGSMLAIVVRTKDTFRLLTAIQSNKHQIWRSEGVLETGEKLGCSLAREVANG